MCQYFLGYGYNSCINKLSITSVHSTSLYGQYFYKSVNFQLRYCSVRLVMPSKQYYGLFRHLAFSVLQYNNLQNEAKLHVELGP